MEARSERGPRGSIAAVRGSFRYCNIGASMPATTAATAQPWPPHTTVGTHYGRSWPYEPRVRPRRRGSLTRRRSAHPPLIYFDNPSAPSLSPGRIASSSSSSSCKCWRIGAGNSAIRVARSSRVILAIRSPMLLSSCPRLWACRRPDLKSRYRDDCNTLVFNVHPGD
jgi:hypothetical protein